MTPLQAVDSPQVSLLKKEEPILLGVVVTALLLELTKYINCGWNSKTVADLAKLLTDRFWMLRIDEFIYVFRRGMEGAYGDVTFSPQQYTNLAQWIIIYQETERLVAEENIRNEQKNLDLKLSHLPTDFVKKISEQAQKAFDLKQKKMYEEMPKAGQVEFDEMNLQKFNQTKDYWSEEQLLEGINIATISRFSKTKTEMEKQLNILRELLKRKK